MWVGAFVGTYCYVVEASVAMVKAIQRSVGFAAEKSHNSKDSGTTSWYHWLSVHKRHHDGHQGYTRNI